MNLTRAQIADIAEQAAEKAVRQVLTELGVDFSDPTEMQADFHHLREMRETCESIKSKGVLTVVGVGITASLALLWLGFRAMLSGN